MLGRKSEQFSSDSDALVIRQNHEPTYMVILGSELDVLNRNKSNRSSVKVGGEALDEWRQPLVQIMILPKHAPELS